MSRAEISVENASVLSALNAMISALDEPLAAYQDIGEYLVESTKRRFAAGESPDGDPWAPNSPVTLSRKSPEQRPLFGSHSGQGSLHNDIYAQADSDGVAVGSPFRYAAAQQFGMPKGFAGTDKRGRSIPWGDIPARPFLGLSDEDEREVLSIIYEHLTDAAARFFV